MAELSYSFHLGRDKNRQTSSRNNAKNNLSGTSSLANNGVQNARQLSKVDNYDFRKDKHLELMTYLAQNVNSDDKNKSNIFLKIASDLKGKNIINKDEYYVILRPPKKLNKSEINSALKSINQETKEAAEEFFKTNKSDYEL